MSVLERNAILREIVSTRTVRDVSGTATRDIAGVSTSFAEALYQQVLRRRPTTVVEVGMAYGVSSLAILTALAELGGERRLISIDPYQSTQWMGIGVANVERAGYSGLHELREMPDFLALPELLREGLSVDFGYIDGWHTFDYTLLDFWYLDRMLTIGGVVAFNDCGMRAVHKVIRFVLSHRRYREVDVGLPRDFSSANRLGSLLRRATGRNAADRYFEKLEAFEPEWSFYAPF